MSQINYLKSENYASLQQNQHKTQSRELAHYSEVRFMTGDVHVYEGAVIFNISPAVAPAANEECVGAKMEETLLELAQ